MLGWLRDWVACSLVALGMQIMTQETFEHAMAGLSERWQRDVARRATEEG